MRFALATERRFQWPVTVRLPSLDTPGTVEEQTFNGLFRLLPEGEASILIEQLRAAETPRDQVEASKAQIRAMLIGWDDGVTDEHGQPVLFNDVALEQALELAAFRAGVLRAYALAAAARPVEGN